ncbi:putative Visual pigment-like receptor peropsin [Hypsibius exemplaris]|uniref:Visual pigment-like receptor peropsin n=1 Tax=Hypsibius exemplaris TaxID=2072580 RepID=A0A1W0WRP7_HYPEX|nr:putative Visual pigment-like receptor peropsin [Hypsibius exemplaris]
MSTDDHMATTPSPALDHHKDPHHPDYYYFTSPSNWFLGTSFALLSVLSILGNALVLLIIARYKRMRTQTNLLLANLASIDLLTGLVAIPFSAVTAANGGWVLGATACQVNGFVNALFAAASLHTLMYIALHKYLSLRFAGSSVMASGSQIRHTVAMIVAAWVWGFLFATGLVAGWTKIEYKIGTTQCGPKIPDRDNLREISHSIFTSASNYLVPFAVIFFCYASIFRMFRRSLATLKSDFQALSRRDYLFRQRKIATTLVIIFLAFLTCWTPYIGYSSSVAFFRDKSRVPPVLNPVAYIFLHLSSCINPVIYAFRSNEFAAGYKAIVRVLCFCGSGSDRKKRGGTARRALCFVKPDKKLAVPVARLPSIGLRRRSLEVARYFVQKMHPHPAEAADYRLATSAVSPPSTTSQTSMLSVGRIPRRRSLSMTWSLQGNNGLPASNILNNNNSNSSNCSDHKREAALLPVPVSTFRFGAVSTPAEPRDRRQRRHHWQKSTIQEEHSSQLLESSSNQLASTDTSTPSGELDGGLRDAE